MKILLIINTVLVLFLYSSMTQAKLLQIIHTNDLHSYFNGPRDGSGGYARLKIKIDDIRKNAEKNGIEILQVDAGDFGEGTSFFFSDDGIYSLKALEKLGVEVSVIGNHDYMLGGDVLANQIRGANMSTKILSANLVATPEMNIGETIKPFYDTNKAGISIRVIGLTTAAPHFEYPLRPGHITPFLKVANEQAAIAKKENKELVIALTHIGYAKDQHLAKYSTDIDLIIGGHSHTALKKVKSVDNKNNKSIPIVQAGANSMYVGSLLIDVVPGKPVKIVKYELIPIKNVVKEDAQVKAFVQKAYENLEVYFNRDLNEIIGDSTIPLSGFKNGVMVLKKSCWGKHMALMQQKAVGSDIGVHLANFEGDSIPAGPIRFIDMIDNFPHLSSYDENGWQIATFSVKGIYLKWLMRGFANVAMLSGLNFSGITYNQWTTPRRIPFFGGRTFVWRMRVNGEKIKNSKVYSLAIPLMAGHTIKSLLPKRLRKYLPHFIHTNVFMWDVMENYLKENSPISCM